MFTNYLKITLRSLWRSKLYTLINIIGLGLGIASIVWAYQNYRFAFSYNEMHPNADHVFRAIVTREGRGQMYGICPMPVGQAAAQAFAGIEEAVRLDSRGMAVKTETGEPFSEQMHFADSNFFDVFNVPLLEGDDDLSDPSAVLISEEMAEKYFGKKEEGYTNAIGKTLILYSGESYQRAVTVRGVFKNHPKNSSFWFGMVTSFDHLIKFEGEPVKADDWGWFADAVFFKLTNPADAPRLAQHLNTYIGVQNSARDNWKVSSFYLDPLSNIANHDEDLQSNSLRERPPDSATYGPLVLAILILLASCLNFANTTVAQSNRRLKEMGIRKVMGGTQGQLMRQMLAESGAIVLLSIVVAVLANKWWLPVYNRMWSSLDLQANYLQDPVLLTFLAGAVVGTTLLAGAYPAFYISRFSPANIFRGSVKFGGSNLFSRILLGLQVAISLMTAIAGVAFAQNSAFQKNYDYGYKWESIATVPTHDETTFTALRNALRQHPGIEAMAGTQNHLGWGYRTVSADIMGVPKETAFMAIGAGYLDVMELKTIAGRAFNPNMETDFEKAVMVNEKFLADLGWKEEEALTRTIRIDTVDYNIIGVLKNFHQSQMYDPLEPLVMRFVRPANYYSLVVRSSPANLKATFENIKTTWAQLYPFKPFEGYYQNEVVANAIETTSNIAWIFSIFAILTVLLTATGLFALVSLTVLKRMKEIAVRKVVGATTLHIVGLINKGYFWIFLVAAVIGGYGGWYLTSLLMDMIFRINVGVSTSTMILSCLAIFLIGGATVGFKVFGAARTNPAEVLKSE